MSLCFGESLVGTSGINGDSFFISPDHSTILLADGASGAGKEGKVLMSKLCVEMIKANPLSASGLSAKVYLDKMIWKINNELISVSQKNKHYIFGTLVICAVQDNTAAVAAIGDSPAYFIHENSIVRVAQTKKHIRIWWTRVFVLKKGWRKQFTDCPNICGQCLKHSSP